MKGLSLLLLLVFIVSSACIYLPSSPGTPGTGTGQSPAITKFDANPDAISAGARAQLSWEVTGATSVSIDNGVGSVALRGTRTVVPAATTTYTMTATNQYGTTNASAQVLVSGGGDGTTPPAAGMPSITSFTATPDTVTAGGSSTLSWNVTNATTVTISPVIGSVNPVAGSGVVTVGSSTTFIMTATNSAGSTNASVTVNVAGTPPLPALVVVNSFTASPPAISSGGSTMLSWNVSGATQVTITGIGPVNSTGSQVVSPVVTTNYTLTATSSGGSLATQTVTVTVGTLGTPPLGQPDLIIQSIAKVETSSGYVIGFTVKNIGPVSAGASICRLFAEGVQKSNANVPAIAAGGTYDGTFSDWIYSPLMPHIKVVAEASGIIAEADETNNEKSVTMAIVMVYDFVTQASSPSSDVGWVSGAGSLTFGGALDDPKGFACYRTNITLEDNNNYDKVLETHPQWIDNGYISGSYYELFNTYAYKVKAGEHFYARCGFIKNASAGKVKYSVMIRCEGGPNTWIFEGVKPYDGTVKVINVDLTPYAGKKADFILQVSAEGSSGQDWAVWEQARIIR
jgi:hypothetical protein